MGKKSKSRANRKLGLMPGSVVYVGEDRTHEVSIDIIDYTEHDHSEKHVKRAEECFPFRDSKTISWINVNGIHNTKLVENLGRHFHLHPLILEDIVTTGQRPKWEESEESLCVVLQMLSYNGADHRIQSEQVSIVFSRDKVLSFQEEQEGDVFGGVRDRLKRTVPRERFMSADYLAYSLMDAIVDHYFVVLEHFGDRVETVENEMLVNPSPDHLAAIRNLKRELLSMRRAVWPLREIVGGLERSESKLIQKETRPYLRDLYEHAVQAIDSVEIHRETVSSLQDIYLSSLSNRMNEVMKMLTIIATIFIPLGFIAGVYGMNFDTDAGPFNMPELGLPFGYIGFWVIALAVGGGLLWFFRRKKWL